MAWNQWHSLDPWGEFRKLQEQLERVHDLFPRWRKEEFPEINLWQDENGSYLITEIPGVESENIQVSVVGDTVTLRGSRKPEEAQEESYHRKERWHGSFTRTLQLPHVVDANKTKAVLQKGVLYLTLPRAEEEKPKSIQIKAS